MSNRGEKGPTVLRPSSRHIPDSSFLPPEIITHTDLQPSLSTIMNNNQLPYEQEVDFFVTFKAKAEDWGLNLSKIPDMHRRLRLVTWLLDKFSSYAASRESHMHALL